MAKAKQPADGAAAGAGATRSQWARARPGAGTGGKASGAAGGRGTAKRSADVTPQASPLPRQVQVAVWLMYGGAALSAIDLIATLLTAGTVRADLRAKYPHWSASLLSQQVHAALLSFAVIWALTIGLWLVMARTNLAGREWARIAATVLCVIDTVSFFIFVGEPSSLLNKLILVPMWAVGLVAIVLLWQVPARVFFREQTGLARARRA